MTVEAREKILSAVNSGINNQLLGYEIDNILESYAKEHAIEFGNEIINKIPPDISGEIIMPIDLGKWHDEWINQ